MSKQDFFKSKEFEEWENKFFEDFYPDQLEALNFLSERKKATICQPTGTGKSRIIYGDLITTFKESSLDTCVIASHRLMLNDQHFNDIFNKFNILLGNIGFIFVGSLNLSIQKFKNKENNIKLKQQKLNYSDIISCNLNTKKEIQDKIQEHKNNGRDVLIITTYDSMDKLDKIDIKTIYIDEAHMLASEKGYTQYRENFEILEFEKSYFFTATPKDAFEDNDNFLMNNEEIFGERYYLSFKDSVDKGYIVPPYYHIAIPENYDSNKDYSNNIQNLSFFINDVFEQHRNWLHEKSAEPNSIEPKLLVKCPNVDILWQLYENLKNENINIFAGASRKPNDHFTHYLNNKAIKERDNFLEEIQKMYYTEKAIILHYDILSEGINVPGITGVFFLNDNIPTKPKILQNLGRATRKHKEDSKKLYNGEISVDIKDNWIKPYCAVIISVMNKKSEEVRDHIKKVIYELRDTCYFHPEIMLTEGDDKAKYHENEDLEDLNELEENQNKKTLKNILHEFEDDKNKLKEDEEKKEIQEAIDNCKDVNEALELLKNIEI